MYIYIESAWDIGRCGPSHLDAESQGEVRNYWSIPQKCIQHGSFLGTSGGINSVRESTGGGEFFLVRYL